MTMNLTPESVDFLRTVFGNISWLDAWVCWKSNMTGKRVYDLRADEPPLDEDTYFSVALLMPGATGRLNEVVDRVRALVIDDVGTKIDQAAFGMFGPTPDWKIESSPDNWQYGWCIDMSRDEYDAFRRRMKAHAIWGKSDGVDAVHLFRLPQGRNTKDGSVWSVKGKLASGKGGAFTDLLAGLPEDQSPQGSGGGSEPDEIEDAKLLASLVNLIPNDKPDRGYWVSLAHAVHGASKGTGFEAFAAWSAKWTVGADDPAANWNLWKGITGSSIGRGWLIREAGAAAGGWAVEEAKSVFDDGAAHPVAGTPVPDAVLALQLTVADKLVALHGHRLKWNVDKVAWHKFDGVWRESPMKIGYELARRWALAALPQLGKAAQNAVAKSGFCEGVEQLMHSALAVTSDVFDRDDWLLGTPGGTVDLRTGLLRSAAAVDMISLSCSVAPSEKEDCPRWLKFIDWACTNPVTGKVDRGMVKSLKQWAGHNLTGDVSKEKVFFLHGGGGNGKGTFVETLQAVLADYFYLAPKDLFMETKHGPHTEETARLAKVRMVAADEVPVTSKWNESFLKACSGGGTMTTRHLYGRVFTFPIKFKVTISGNNKPEFQGTVNDAIRRRMHLVGFLNKANPQSDTLKAELRAEAAGVLRWMINGLVDMQSAPGGRLFIADSMISATEGYFNESDLMGQWLAENVTKAAGSDLSVTDAIRDWREWRNAEGDHVLFDMPKNFKAEMQNRGYVWKETMKGNVIKDIRLKTKTVVF